MEWLGGTEWFREPDWQSTGRVIESRPLRCRVQPWAGCSHTCPCHRAVQFGTGQWAVMLGGWGGNRGPGRWQPGLWLRSPAG